MEIKDLKKYLKDNEQVEQFFYTGLKEKTLNEKYLYLKNHFQYYVNNSWNVTKTIANNVKIYNLGLTNEQQNAFFEINEIDYNFIYYETIDDLKEFEDLTKTKVYSNGRSGGYFILCDETTNKHIFEPWGVIDVLYFDNYKEFKKEQNEYTSGYNYSYKNDIEFMYYFVKCFDKVCDILRSDLIYILNNYKIETETITETREIKTIEL